MTISKEKLFIITGEELLDIEQRIGALYCANKIRSRPLSEHDAEIRMKESGRVISKLETRKVMYRKYAIGTEMIELSRIRIEEIDGIIESLRGEP